MSLVVLREVPEDPRLRQQWNALLERVERPQVFYTYEWALAVQRAYSDTLRPLIFLSYGTDQTLGGIAALATNPACDRASFLCATTADYCDFLSLPGERSGFLDEVFAELAKRNIRKITLANLPADSATSKAIRQVARKYRYRCFVRPGYECAQISFRTLDRTNGQEVEIPRRKMLRRSLKTMGRHAPVRLDHARSWQIVQGMLPQFFQTHIGRFLATGRISSMARRERRIFLAELAKLLSEFGALSVSRLVYGERAIAWNYGFQFHGTWFWYQPTFDTEFEKHSPGFCLLAKLVEEAAGDPFIHELDLGLGAEGYKELFANATRETLHVTLAEKLPAHVREMVRYRAATIVKVSPKIETGVRNILARMQSLKHRFASQGIWRTLAWLGGRLRDIVWLRAEVFFYEWCGAATTSAQTLKLEAFSLNHLADAVAQNADDPETLAYLLRAAQRLRSESGHGFALVDQAGTYLHFAWTTAFDGFFLSELNAKVDAPVPDSIMLFDCWTPFSQRGQGHYGRMIELIAAEAKARGKRAWIFSAATNTASIRGIEGSGFQRRYSLVRKRLLGWQRIIGPRLLGDEVTMQELSVRA